MSKINLKKIIATFFALLAIILILLSFQKIAGNNSDLRETNENTLEEVNEEIIEETIETEETLEEIYEPEIRFESTGPANDVSRIQDNSSYLNVAGNKDFELNINGEIITAKFKEGDSVHDAMNKMKDYEFIDFKEKSFVGLGAYIYSINGISENKREGKYWIYYINDKEANVGVSNYLLKQEDEIRWQLETNTY